MNSGSLSLEEHLAACHCGQLVLRCQGAPKKISMCHCPDCQRRTGSAFSIAVFYKQDRVHRQGVAATAMKRRAAFTSGSGSRAKP